MRIFKRLAGLWGRWFARAHEAPPSAPPAAPAAPEIPWGRIAELLQPPEPKLPRLTLPDVLPGVRPPEGKWPAGEKLVLAQDSGCTEIAMDSAPVEPAAWGFSNGQVGIGLAFLGFPYLAELAQISEYRIPAEALSTEMTRRWLELTNTGDEDLKDTLQEITARAEQLNLQGLVREALLKTEQFGRAHLYVSVKGQDDERTRQLPLTEIGKGDLLGFSCIEPYWLTPYSWNSTQPERSDFYKPQSWFVLGRKTHTTRLLTFILREVPDLLKPAYDFAGISITQLMMPYVQRWLRTAKNVNDVINIFSIVTLHTELQSLLQDPDKFMKRLQTFVQTRDNRGLMMIQKDTEDLTVQNVSLASLDKLQAQAQEHMATPARMPLIKFFGITPTGLNTDGGEEEMRVWYDYVHSLQELISPLIKRAFEFIQMDLYGKVNPNIGHKWIELFEPTGKEKAEIRTADAQRDGVLIEKSVVSPDEVRDKLKADPESGYNNLKGDAPEPPELTELPQGGGSPGQNPAKAAAEAD